MENIWGSTSWKWERGKECVQGSKYDLNTFYTNMKRHNEIHLKFL
jgi:hypothetical protein